MPHSAPVIIAGCPSGKRADRHFYPIKLAPVFDESGRVRLSGSAACGAGPGGQRGGKVKQCGQVAKAHLRLAPCSSSRSALVPLTARL